MQPHRHHEHLPPHAQRPAAVGALAVADLARHLEIDATWVLDGALFADALNPSVELHVLTEAIARELGA